MNTTAAPLTRSFLVLLASGRRGGNTEHLARAAAAGLAPDVSQRWIRLSDHPLAPFEDIRHTGDGRCPAPEGNERVLLDATLAASDLVVASPLYWYSVTASAKLYLDHWSGWLRVPGVDFKARMRGKTLWTVSAYSSDDVAMVDPLLGTLRLTADYLGMRWGGALLANANRPGEAAADPATAARARGFFAAPASSRPDPPVTPTQLATPTGR